MRKKEMILLLLVLLFPGIQSLSSQELDQFVVIISFENENAHCYNPVWSEDSRFFAFNYNSSKRKNIYIFSLREGKYIPVIDKNNEKPLTHFFWRASDNGDYLFNFLFHSPVRLIKKSDRTREVINHISKNLIFSSGNFSISESDPDSIFNRYASYDKLYDVRHTFRAKRYFKNCKLFGLRYHKPSTNIFVFNNEGQKKTAQKLTPSLYLISDQVNMERRREREKVKVKKLESFLKDDMENIRTETTNKQSYILRIDPGTPERALFTTHKATTFELFLIENFASDKMVFHKLPVLGPVIYDAIWIDDDEIAYLAADSIQRSESLEKQKKQGRLYLRIFNMKTNEEISVDEVNAKMHPFWNPVLYNETPSIYYDRTSNRIYFIGEYGSGNAPYYYDLDKNEVHLLTDELSLPDYINVSPDGKYAAIVAKGFTPDSKYYDEEDKQYFYKIIVFRMK